MEGCSLGLCNLSGIQGRHTIVRRFAMRYTDCASWSWEGLWQLPDTMLTSLVGDSEDVCHDV